MTENKTSQAQEYVDIQKLVDAMYVLMERGEIPWLVEVDGKMVSSLHAIRETVRILEENNKWSRKCLGENGIDLEAYIRFHS